MRDELLIVGIDPGITTAYAILDGAGQVRKLRSSKELSLNKLLSEITAEGKVLVIGTDVKRVPGLIEKFSARVGAKVITPLEDMKVGLKERMTQPHNPRDDHQRDALAAALCALKEVQPTLQKIDETLKKLGKEHLSNEVKVRVLRGINISHAVELLEKKEDEAVVRRRRLKTAFKKSSRFVEENKYLRKENQRLLQRTEYLNASVQQLLKKINLLSERKAEDVVKFKDKKIGFLNQQLDKAKKESAQLQQQLKATTSLMLEARDKIIAKKLDTLGWEEVRAKVEPGDILLVDDPKSFSDHSLAELKKKVSTIIYKKTPSKEIAKLGFCLVNAANLQVRETETLALVDKEALEREKKKKDLLATIVQEYQEERKSLL